jgi:probable H4MPT-linked C1 transfer pathway protein
MNWLALDIGGANVKAADGLDWSWSVPFPLWRKPEQLPAELAKIFHAAPPCDRVAITMTGELCDCFATKADGVRHIIRAIETAAGSRPISVYLVNGRLVSPDEARLSPQLAAASNWHVLARFAANLIPNGAGVLIDVGSTTTDIVPIVDGRPRPHGLDDTSRLQAGELVYSGVLRTPICAVTNRLPWRGNECPVAAELFATTADAYVVLGDVPENPDDSATADGRPRTREFAHGRLARMICSDTTVFTMQDAVAAAKIVKAVQVDQIQEAAARIAANSTFDQNSVVVSGAGEFLAASVAERLWPKAEIASLTQRIGRTASQCAPAFALANLARTHV